ncbi:hypothetical protein GAPWKB11_1043 [Gilliamella apicola]|nr:hypothetical protein GAPWKB11_1043 [Gilliamella apicola]
MVGLSIQRSTVLVNSGSELKHPTKEKLQTSSRECFISFITSFVIKIESVKIIAQTIKD